LRKKENQIKKAEAKALKAAETSTPESEELTALVKAAMSKKAAMVSTPYPHKPLLIRHLNP
jgi:hypothetical protein